jgi:hypothetical protein
MKLGLFVFLLLLFPLSNAFSIEDYQSNVLVKIDGSIEVYEKMTFILDEEYSEGFRSIRKEDFKDLSDISINSVNVNGIFVPYSVQMNGDK